jgi:hypothetical protein
VLTELHDPVGVEVVDVLVGFEVDVGVPGRHCEYHWFEYTQVAPETQVVSPVYP